MDGSAIMCDKIMEGKLSTKDSELLTKKWTYIFLVFLLITIALLIAVSIYCYLIKYQTKQWYKLPLHDTNNWLKQVIY